MDNSTTYYCSCGYSEKSNVSVGKSSHGVKCPRCTKIMKVKKNKKELDKKW